MKACHFIILSAVLLALASPQIVSAQEEKEALRIYYMDEIVVTATRTDRAIKDLSATVSVITREDIEASNANSCTDILNALPGVFVERTGAFGRADVDIRGLGERGRKAMVMVDGRPVKMGLYGCTVTHSLPLNNVERIEVVRGPASVLYGSDALGGVINIITRTLSETPHTDYTFSYGTHHTYQHRLRAGGGQGRLSFYATADKRQTNGHVPHSAYDGKDFTAQVGYDISDHLKAVLNSKFFEAHKDEPLLATDPDTLVSDVWDDYKRGAVDMTFKGGWGRWNGSMKLYRNFGEHEFSDGWHSKDFTNGWMIHSTGRLFASNELTAGIEFRQQGGERLSDSPGEWDKSEYAAYFHDEQILLNKHIFTFGARYNYDQVAGSAFCPQVGVVLHVREGTTVRGVVNKGSRSPQINELYLFPASNEDLEPEEVWNYELGLTQRLVHGVALDVVGYTMKGEHLIQQEKNDSPPPMFLFKNTGSFTFKGLEAGVRSQVGKALSGRLYYTYLDPGEHTTGRPGDKVDFGLRYVWRKLAVSLNTQYVTDYFAADHKQQPISDYFVADTKLSYEVIPGLRVSIAVDNLFDEEYETYTDLPGGAAGLYAMPRRTVTGGVMLEL